MKRSYLPKATHRLHRGAIFAAAGLFALLGTSVPSAVAGDNVPDCMRVWGEARYRDLGYDHIVHLNNGCAASASCNVSTNVNPTPVRVEVPARQEMEVLTFRGSPSREFDIHAECGLVLISPSSAGSGRSE